MIKQDMKIRVTEENRGAVWAALEKLGYNLEGCSRAKFLYTYNYTVDCFYGTAETSFKEHVAHEYILTPQGTFAKVEDYYKQPETSYVPTTGSASAAVPPLGLLPKKIHDQQRLLEIIDAMSRYASTGIVIPAEWFAEAQYLNGQMEGK